MSIAEAPSRVAPATRKSEERTKNDELRLPPMPTHLRQILKKYRQPSLWRASWQIVNTLVPMAILWWAAWQSFAISYWITLTCCVGIAALMLRTFVLHHDCTHGSFFKTRRANEFWGFVLGVLTFTPFHRWRRSHNYHHAHSGDLDHRGEGYITMYTVAEYEKLSAKQKIWYRVYRHPMFMFFVAPFLQFIILERFTFDLPQSAKVARRGVWMTNLALLAIPTIVYFLAGWSGVGQFLAILFPSAAMTATAGVWLFFVQHNYDEAYFQNHENWNFSVAALEGCSFFDLPAWAHWISGNIGYHHIHHLDSTIPNYNLPRCHYENDEFQTPYRLTLWNSFKCAGLDLWDEEQQRLISFAEAARKKTTA